MRMLSRIPGNFGNFPPATRKAPRGPHFAVNGRQKLPICPAMDGPAKNLNDAFIATDQLASEQTSAVDLATVIRAMSAVNHVPWHFFAVKRACDIALALAILVLGFPFGVLIAMA